MLLHATLQRPRLTLRRRPRRMRVRRPRYSRQAVLLPFCRLTKGFFRPRTRNREQRRRRRISPEPLAPLGRAAVASPASASPVLALPVGTTAAAAKRSGAAPALSPVIPAERAAPTPAPTEPGAEPPPNFATDASPTMEFLVPITALGTKRPDPSWASNPPHEQPASAIEIAAIAVPDESPRKEASLEFRVPELSAANEMRALTPSRPSPLPRRAAPVPADGAPAASAPTPVSVTIGRLEIRVTPGREPTPARTTPAVMSLEDYLRSRGQGGEG